MAPALPDGQGADRRPGPTVEGAPQGVRGPLRHRRLGRRSSSPRPASAAFPLGGDLLAAYIGEELARCREALAESRSGKGLSVKRLERRIAQLEETYQRLLADGDQGRRRPLRGDRRRLPVLSTRPTCYKNRRVDSAIDGMANPGSQRAQDLDAKLWALRRVHGPRVVTFATATPVANSIAELWIMQSYLQPDALAGVGLARLRRLGGHVRPDRHRAGAGPRRRQLPDQDPLRPLPERPRAAHAVPPGGRRAHGRGPRPAGPGARRRRARDGGRAGQPDAPRATWPSWRPGPSRSAAASVTPDEDNMLKITGDGRQAALDLRLVGEHPDPDGRQARGRRRPDRRHPPRRPPAIATSTRHGEPHPRPGGLQLVFCDVSTPVRFGLERLRRAADPARATEACRQTSVRFVHEASTDEAKAKLFAACRDGRVAVLVGSTEKMGVGTNVQARADRPAPPRLPVAAGRHRAARGPDRPPGQPEPRGVDPPLRHRGQLRHLHVAG